MIKKVKYKDTFLDVIIDDEDEKLLSSHTWNIRKTDTGIFHVSNSNCKTNTSGFTFFHRMLLNLTDTNILVDHINRNGLDNRKENLRLSNKSTNAMNRGKNKNNKSGYKGVSLDRRFNTWSAELMAGLKRYRVHGFKTKEEAAKKYNELAMEHHKEFAVFNIIKGKNEEE